LRARSSRCKPDACSGRPLARQKLRSQQLGLIEAALTPLAGVHGDRHHGQVARARLRRLVLPALG
jgi:predicted trehalose synthase